MEIIKNFGIDPVLLTAQIVNFLIILYIVKRFALKPILTLLKNREKTIKTGLQQAEEARVLLEKTQTRESEILKKAHVQAKEMIAETKKQTEVLSLQNEEKTKQRIEKMLSDARSQIEVESLAMEKRLVAHVNELAVSLIEKSAPTLFGQKEQTEVIDNVTKKLKKTN